MTQIQGFDMRGKVSRKYQMFSYHFHSIYHDIQLQFLENSFTLTKVFECILPEV